MACFDKWFVWWFSVPVLRGDWWERTLLQFQLGVASLLTGEMFRLIAKGILTAHTKCVVTEACQHQRCGTWTGLWGLVPVHLVVQWLWRLKPDATGFESCRCLLVAHSQRKHLLKNLILSTGCNRLLSITITTYCHTPLSFSTLVLHLRIQV